MNIENLSLNQLSTILELQNLKQKYFIIKIF